MSGGGATVVAALGYSFNRATANATIQATNTNAMSALDAGHAGLGPASLVLYPSARCIPGPKSGPWALAVRDDCVEPQSEGA